MQRLARYRQKLREQGLRPLHIWLPAAMIERIDAMKEEGEGRDAIIAKLIAENLETTNEAGSTNQLELAL